MNGNSRINYGTRNKKKGMIISTTSRNILMEKNDINNEEDNENNISYEEIKEKKSVNQNRIIFYRQNDEIDSTISKRSNENKLLLKTNHNFNKALQRNKYDKMTNVEFPINKIETYTFYKNNLNKKTIEPINFNETDNYIYDEDNKENNSINLKNIENEEELEENNNKKILDIFNLIVGYNFNQIIEPDYIKIFFLSSVPEDKTLSMNINKINNNENNSSNLNFSYNLEILKNNQIYFFAQVKKSFPSSNIKLYIKLFNGEYIKVGKIISNFLKNNFIVYKGDNKSNYIKILNITYEYNFFGSKIRKMKVEKFEGNRIVYTLCNDLPEWDYFYKTYKLNFNGRVKQKSKKNFILKYQNIDDNNNNENRNEKLLQCGKINDNCFALDFISPLSPFEAFSISITSIIYKISCE